MIRAALTVLSLGKATAFAQGSAGATPWENGDAAFRTYHSAAGQ
jgi:hypothetical protein